MCRPIRGREERPTAFASEADSNLKLIVLSAIPRPRSSISHGPVLFVPRNFNEKTLPPLITIAGGENDRFSDPLRGVEKGQRKDNK
jgi:hypothetical protein